MKTKILIFLTSLMLVGALFGEDKADAKAEALESKSEAKAASETKAQIKARIESNVVKADNGDVIIKMPDTDDVKGQNTGSIPPSLVKILCYIVPNMDFEDFAKRMGKRKDNYIDTMIDVAKEYLASKNINFKLTSFSANNMRLKLSEGLPMLAFFYIDDTAFDAVKERQGDRPTDNLKAMDEWVKSLRKTEVKNFKKGKHCFNVMISGFNKETGEYLLVGNGKPYWITENELKKSVYQIFTLRY